MSTSKVEQAAMRWMEARIEKERLREKRNAMLCVHEKIVTHREPALFGEGRPVEWTYTDGDACWKGKWENEGPEGTVFVTNRSREDGEWCERCIERDSLNEQFKRARALQTGRMSALTRVCRAAFAQTVAAQRSAKVGEGET